MADADLDEPSSFARDLAMVLLIELERLQREATDCHKRFAAMHAANIRAQLATSPPQCPACIDAAVVQVAERLRRSVRRARREARSCEEAPRRSGAGEPVERGRLDLEQPQVFAAVRLEKGDDYLPEARTDDCADADETAVR